MILHFLPQWNEFRDTGGKEQVMVVLKASRWNFRLMHLPVSDTYGGRKNGRVWGREYITSHLKRFPLHASAFPSGQEDSISINIEYSFRSLLRYSERRFPVFQYLYMWDFSVPSQKHRGESHSLLWSASMIIRFNQGKYLHGRSIGP